MSTSIYYVVKKKVNDTSDIKKKINMLPSILRAIVDMCEYAYPSFGPP
jgi:hypothetical protein